MNQKKCPKCGENNPAEAVMCWACYTPLTGGAMAGAATGTTGPGAPGQPPGGVQAEPPTKKIEPWQMGLVGLALLIGLGAGFNAMRGGSQEVYKAPTVFDFPSTTTGDTGATDGSGTTSVAPPTIGNGGGPSIIQPTPEGTAAYSVVLAPSPRDSFATIGIVPNRSIQPAEAASLASAARQATTRDGQYKGVHIYVFADMNTARAFRQQVKGRRGLLSPNEMAALKEVWKGTLARYEYFQGREATRYPQSNPSGWWNGQPVLPRS